MNLRVLKFLRLLHLLDKQTYNRRRHIALIENSSYFDKKYYMPQFPDINFDNISPAEHYLIMGWKNGANPSQYFLTNDYLEEYPDVKATGINPLLHYEINGKEEGRYRNKVSEENLYCVYGKWYDFLRKFGRWIYKKDIRAHQDTKILVHLHLFYINAWCEIEEYLKNLSCYCYDLVVTYPEDIINLDFIEQIKLFKSDAKIIPAPNKGFDIGPFIAELAKINLSDYDIIYHLHSKSVAGKKGRLAYGKIFRGKSWFQQLYSGCLGVLNVHRGIKILSGDNNYGMIGAGNLIVKDMPYRYERVKEYAYRYGLQIFPDYNFLIGSCFAIRAKLLSNIKNLQLNLKDFPDSQRSIFTFAHALERIFASEVLNAGYNIYKMPVLHNNHILQVWQKKIKEKKFAEKIITILKEYALENIELLSLDVKSGLKCLFLKGKYKDKDVFIKYRGIEEIVINEVNMQNMMHLLMPKHVPEILLYNKNPTFVVMDLIKGYNLEELLNFGVTKFEQRDILSQLEEIKTVLLKSKFVHRDIQPANLIYSEGRLYLIDYQFMVEKKEDGSLNELDYVLDNKSIQRSLGGIYRYSETEWNDEYSINMIIEKIKNVILKEKSF